MGLGKTLMKVALGVAVAKGMQGLAQRSNSSGGVGGGLGSGRGAAGSAGGLGGLLGELMGNNSGTPAGRGGRGGDLLEGLLGTKRSGHRANAPTGGLAEVLQKLTTGRGAGGSGGLGGLASTLGAGGIGGLLGSVLGGAATPAPGATLQPEVEEEVSAALLLKAIIQAVKADGHLDEDEKRKLMDAMGDASQEEIAAVNAELATPVDVQALVRLVPDGMEGQIYLASLSAITLDSKEEADYLHSLAEALELTPEEVRVLHERAGASPLYR
ncbi:DUF533 domain-containing protein [Xinfangfangia sp. CPCC 101601]|uniref:DUF533 domain-containing protein n=1 Tax=Pseudogemmobacter lacusdianii TaxID=3069608 RepID=A0ABU0W122_9RHOB|nr:DUF533 domain-containing protein [Xinfangfangia sp. CPCC 101601]MDQ2067664.1 DUF533 domain-containing protein [Xinfangfangia sp. CPCC 101601]